MCLDILKKDVLAIRVLFCILFRPVDIYSVTDISNTICDDNKNLLVTLIIPQDCGT